MWDFKPQRRMILPIAFSCHSRHNRILSQIIFVWIDSPCASVPASNILQQQSGNITSLKLNPLPHLSVAVPKPARPPVKW
jgi:hypothetical protein